MTEGKNGWFQVEQAACAPLIQIPVEKVQVTGFLIKQAKLMGGKNDLFACFCVSERGRKTGNKQSLLAWPEKKKLLCDASE